MGSNPSFPFGIGLQNIGQGWDWLLRIPWTNICSESVGREHTAVTAAGVTLDTWAWLVSLPSSIGTSQGQSLPLHLNRLPVAKDTFSPSHLLSSDKAEGWTVCRSVAEHLLSPTATWHQGSCREVRLSAGVGSQDPVWGRSCSQLALTEA